MSLHTLPVVSQMHWHRKKVATQSLLMQAAAVVDFLCTVFHLEKAVMVLCQLLLCVPMLKESPLPKRSILVFLLSPPIPLLPKVTSLVYYRSPHKISPNSTTPSLQFTFLLQPVCGFYHEGLCSHSFSYIFSYSDQDAIWRYVQLTVKKEFHFKFEDSWAQTVTGFYEALYGWITVNYLLGNFVGEFIVDLTVGRNI